MQIAAFPSKKSCRGAEGIVQEPADVQKPGCGTSGDADQKRRKRDVPCKTGEVKVRDRVHNVSPVIEGINEFPAHGSLLVKFPHHLRQVQKPCAKKVNDQNEKNSFRGGADELTDIPGKPAVKRGIPV